MKFKPTMGRVLIEPILEKQATIGGIHIPEAYQENKASEGTVVSLPQESTTEVKLGDRVLFNRFNGQEMKSGNKLFKLIDQNEILAIID